MKVYSQLVSAQAENKASDYSSGTAGRFWFNTSTSLLKFDDGSAVRVVVTLDNTQTLTNKTLTDPTVAITSSTNKAAYFNGSGNLAAETTLATSRGGTNLSSYVAGDVLYASATNVLSALAKGTDGQVLKLASGFPSWATAGSLQASSKSTNYSVTASDGLLIATATLDFTMPTPSTATGNIFAFYNAGNGSVRILPHGSEKFNSTMALFGLQISGSWAIVIGDGTNWWVFG